MQTITQPILFIGGGNMAHAIISGAIASKTLVSDAVAVIEPKRERHELYENAFVDSALGMSWLGKRSKTVGVIVLAVKPQMLEAAAQPIRDLLASLPYQPLVVSILAGTRIEQVEKAFDHQARVIRVMPNTPAQIGQGMSAIAPSNSSTQADIQLADQLFSSIGKAITISQDLMDAFTAIAGSGPAYLFYLAQAMTQAATELGFNEQQAQTIVSQTILGSSMLLDASDDSPKTLRTKVTSKNGTTQAATDAMDDSKVMSSIITALHAARDRGVELGNS